VNAEMLAREAKLRAGNDALLAPKRARNPQRRQEALRHGRVGHIPSLFHIHQNIRLALMRLHGASEMVNDRRVLIPGLSQHLDYLRRDVVLNLAPRDWTRWWDDLIARGQALPASDTTIRDRRTVYQDRVASALPLLRKQLSCRLQRGRRGPDPADARTVHRVQAGAPVSEPGQDQALLSLAVCRSQGGLGDMDNISRVIRTDNENAGGWSPLPRAINDAQPPLATPSKRAAAARAAKPRNIRLPCGLARAASAQTRTRRSDDPAPTPIRCPN
jgi:hypothetical protein